MNQFKSIKYQASNSMSTSPEPHIIKDIILNVHTPQVLKGIPLGWKCFTQDLSEWTGLFDDAPQNQDGVIFDCGPMANGSSPQWESKRGSRKMTTHSFVEKFRARNEDGLSNQNECSNQHEHSKQTEWASFSYKQLKDLPAECSEGVSFEKLGFAEMSDFTFWLGSAGAHTPCHYDTYGVNVVVQVYGRKSWLLFPPSAKLKPTRVPYEESSVYCQENFFSPDGTASFCDIEDDAYHILLEPGDVLIVPHKWWHFVESLDISLAINKWIPLIRDLDAQINECLVKINVTEYSRGLNDDIKRALINPNELTSLYETPLVEHLRLLSLLRRLQADADLHRETIAAHPSDYLDVAVVDRLLGVQTDVRAVQKCTPLQFRKFIESNRQRFDRGCDAEFGIESTEDYQILVMFINITCCAGVVKAVSSNLSSGPPIEVLIRTSGQPEQEQIQQKA